MLISSIRLLEVIHHEEAVSETAPDLAIARVELEDILDKVHRLGELLLVSQDSRDSRHGDDRVRIGTQRVLVRDDRLIRAIDEFEEAPCAS